MITDLLLVAGGFLGGAILTWSFCRWEDATDDYQRLLDETVARHPSNPGPTPAPPSRGGAGPDDIPDWLNG